MMGGDDFRERIGERVVRLETKVKGLQLDGADRDISINALWSKIWTMFLMLMGAQTVIIILFATFILGDK